jgi:hypothetical protein
MSPRTEKSLRSVAGPAFGGQLLCHRTQGNNPYFIDAITDTAIYGQPTNRLCLL